MLTIYRCINCSYACLNILLFSLFLLYLTTALSDHFPTPYPDEVFLWIPLDLHKNYYHVLESFGSNLSLLLVYNCQITYFYLLHTSYYNWLLWIIFKNIHCSSLARLKFTILLYFTRDLSNHTLTPYLTDMLLWIHTIPYHAPFQDYLEHPTHISWFQTKRKHWSWVIGHLGLIPDYDNIFSQVQ